MPWSPTTGTTFADSLDGLLNPAPTGNALSMFSTFSPTVEGESVYNTNLWGGGGPLLDWTGIIWLDDNNVLPNGVAITKRHIICCDHVGHDTGDNVTWIKANGSLVTRAIVDQINDVGGIGLRILYLGSDLPAGIAIYPVMGNPNLLAAEYGIIKFDNENKALAASFNGNSAAVAATTPLGSNATRLSYYEDAISGDSCSPMFAVKGTQLYYISSLVTASTYNDGRTAGNGPFAAGVPRAIRNACATLDARNSATGYKPTIFGRTFGIDYNQSLGLGLTI